MMRTLAELEDQAQILVTGRVPTVETLFVLPSPWHIAAAHVIPTPGVGHGFLIPG